MFKFKRRPRLYETYGRTSASADVALRPGGFVAWGVVPHGRTEPKIYTVLLLAIAWLSRPPVEVVRRRAVLPTEGALNGRVRQPDACTRALRHCESRLVLRLAMD